MNHGDSCTRPGARPMIVVDATPLQSDHRLRGVGTYTRHLTQHLALTHSDEIRYIATVNNLDLLAPEVAAASIAGARPHQPAQVYWLYNEWFLRRMVARARPALFHATDFNGLVRVGRIPTVATLYDLTMFKQGFNHRGVSARLSDLRWWVYYYRKLPRADHIIAISENARQDAVHLLDIPADRITTIPLGVDLDRFKPMQNDGAYASEPPYLLFVGGRTVNKNLDRVLDAFITVAKDARDLTLYLAGPWRGEDQQWLGGKCMDTVLRRQIRHVGFVDEADLPSLYSNARAFLFPSLEEGFGLPVLEAMACGTPVITSNRGALLEVAGDAALLVDPTDTAQISAAIGRIVGDGALRGDLRQRGLQRVQDFRWEDVARRTFQVYTRVLAGT